MRKGVRVLDNDRAMRLLLIEDEAADCLRFSECAKRRTDIMFVGMTDSCEEGIQMVKALLPEAVILDLQLVKGEGSGLQFMERLKEETLSFYPLVVVTTSNESEAVYRRVEELGADWFFRKTQRNYSPDFVINTLLSLRKSISAKQEGGAPIDRQAILSPEERETRIYKRIDAELDLIGIRGRLKGRIYLSEGIYFQIISEKAFGSVIEQVALKHKHSYGTIAKVMQTAINNAWRDAAPGELEPYYTARIRASTGVPTTSDFIHYYADKIRRSI